MICGLLIYDTIIGRGRWADQDRAHTQGNIDSKSSTKRFPIRIRTFIWMWKSFYENYVEENASDRQATKRIHTQTLNT